jgi:hypothetical protein
VGAFGGAQVRRLVAVLAVLVAAACSASGSEDDPVVAASTTVPGSTGVETTTTPTTAPVDDRLVPAATVGKAWGAEVEGLLTFRGNPSRTFYGAGPVPAAP